MQGKYGLCKNDFLQNIIVAVWIFRLIQAKSVIQNDVMYALILFVSVFVASKLPVHIAPFFVQKLAEALTCLSAHIDVSDNKDAAKSIRLLAFKLLQFCETRFWIPLNSFKPSRGLFNFGHSREGLIRERGLIERGPYSKSLMNRIYTIVLSVFYLIFCKFNIQFNT